MEFIPHDYQREIIKAIRAHNTFVICKMGGGKTAATLEAVRPAKGRILIVAPLRVANHQWPAEIAKWDNFKDMDYAVCTGALAKRKKALDADAKLTIVNRENVKWLVEYVSAQCVAEKKAWPWSCLIIDESSSFKSHSALRFKALRKVQKLFKRVVLLTGTPTPNSLLEIWSQVCLLDGGERLESGITKFRNKYFRTTDYMGYKWEPKDGTEDAITAKISDLCVVIEKYDGLPDRVDVETPVYLNGAMAAYKQFEEKTLLDINESEITAANAAVVMGKLCQIAGGAVYDDEGEVVHIHDEKLEQLEEHMEALEGQNVLVAYNYKHEVARIKARFPHAVDIKEPGAIDAWNRGEISMLLAHPASAGHGLNLWEGGRNIIWFSPTWSNELKQQFDARLWRQGQTDKVWIHTLVAKGTVDERIMAVVDGRKTVQEAVIEQIKELS